jgi:hypothetical protein
MVKLALAELLGGRGDFVASPDLAELIDKLRRPLMGEGEGQLAESDSKFFMKRCACG